MGYWVRSIKSVAEWGGVDANTPDGDILLRVLADFIDPRGEVSVWFVDDLSKSLCRVAAALQQGDRPKNLTFRVVEETALEALSIPTPRKDPGESLDAELNDEAHFIFRIRNFGEVAGIVRAFAALPPEPVNVKDIGEQIAASIRDGFIALKKLNHDMCKWLVENDKLVIASAPASQGQGEIASAGQTATPTVTPNPGEQNSGTSAAAVTSEH